MTTRKYDIVSEVRRAVSLLLNINDMSDTLCLDEVKKCLVDVTVNISELRVLPDRYVELVRESVTGIVTEQLKAVSRHNLIAANRCKKEIAYIEGTFKEFKFSEADLADFISGYAFSTRKEKNMAYGIIKECERERNSDFNKYKVRRKELAKQRNTCYFCYKDCENIRTLLISISRACITELNSRK